MSTNKLSESSSARNFLEADSSIFKSSLLLDETTLRKVGYEGPHPQLAGPSGDVSKPILGEDNEHILMPNEAKEAKNCLFVVPEAGKCIKTKDQKSKDKVFVNICTSDKVPMPTIYFTETQLANLLSTGSDSEIGDVRIPMSVGQKRVERDKNGSPCQTYDIIINTNFFKDKILTSELYFTFLIVLSLEAVDSKHGTDLDKNGYITMKNKLCHGTPEPHFVRNKAWIQEINSVATNDPSPAKIPKNSNYVKKVDTSQQQGPTQAKSKEESSALEFLTKDSNSEPLIREVSTKLFKKEQDLSVRLILSRENKNELQKAKASAHLPFIKSQSELDVKCKNDNIMIKIGDNLSEFKVPLNINSFTTLFNEGTKELVINLKLSPLSEDINKNWKENGHDLVKYEKRLGMKLIWK